MTITILGIVWIVVLCYLLIKRSITELICALIFSTIFQATSVINLEGKGINFIIVAEVFLLIKYVLTKKDTKIKTSKFLRDLLFFIVYSIIVSCIAVVFFVGKEFPTMYSKTNTVNFGISFNLILKIVMISFHFIAVFIIYNVRDKIEIEKINKIVHFSIVVVLFAGFWEYLSKIGIMPIKFPVKLIYNNIGYNQLFDQGVANGSARLNSTFLEASYCGCFLAASFWYLINEKEKKIGLIILVVIAILLNRSGTAMFSLVGVAFLFFFKELNVKYLLGYTVLILCLIIVYNVTDFLNPIMDTLINKPGSRSAMERNYYNTIALKIFQITYYLGGGLAVYRGSSFVCSLLGTTGVIGSILFYSFLSRIVFLKKYDKFSKSVKYMFLSVILSLCSSLPDINSFTLWMVIFVGVALIKKDYKEEKNIN